MHIDFYFHWFGQDSVLLRSGSGTMIFVDPFNLPGNYSVKADAVFITHPHFDHLSLDDLSKVASTDTPLYLPADSYKKMKSEGYRNLHKLKPGSSFRFKDISIDVFPAYNIKKSKYHPRKNQWLGYVFSIDGKRIYIPGDTERIPEMKEVMADVAFMPLGQTYTMGSVEEAVEAVADTNAKLAIPFHYGMFEGTYEDALKFKRLLEERGTAVEVFSNNY